MKLFIFRPCQNWEYMGGAVAFVARDFDDIDFLVQAEIRSAKGKQRPWQSIHAETYLERPFRATDHTESGHEDLPNCHGHWVLDNEFELAGERAPGLVFENHHDG